MSDAKQCTGCDGDGWLSHVDGRVDCDVCGGAGKREAQTETHTLTVTSPDWKALLVTSTKLSAVATASRETAATLRAIGGPVAETIAARADETARAASEGALVAVAEAAARWVGSSTEGE